MANFNRKNGKTICFMKKKVWHGFLCGFFSAISLTYPSNFAGMMQDNTYALIKAHAQSGVWFYSVGVISQIFKPYFPGPDGIYYVSEVRFMVKKDC
jgi:hypothetical protein